MSIVNNLNTNASNNVRLDITFYIYCCVYEIATWPYALDPSYQITNCLQKFPMRYKKNLGNYLMIWYHSFRTLFGLLVSVWHEHIIQFHLLATHTHTHIHSHQHRISVFHQGHILSAQKIRLISFPTGRGKKEPTE